MKYRLRVLYDMARMAFGRVYESLTKSSLTKSITGKSSHKVDLSKIYIDDNGWVRSRQENGMINNNLVFKVKTTISGEVVHQNISVNGDSLYRSMLDTAEKQTQDALIKLGWTPPQKKGWEEELK